jgi:hypothetical protein
VLGDQALTKRHQGTFAKGWSVAVQTVQHQLPPTIHGRDFDHFIVGDLCVGLEQGRQRQLGRRDGGMTLRLVLIELEQFLLPGISKQRMTVLAQEDEQLGAADALENGVCCRRQLDWGMPQRWTHGKPSLGNGKKKTIGFHAITSWKNTRPMF